MKPIHPWIVALTLLFAAAPVLAQTPTTLRVRGVVEAVDGSALVVKSREGKTLKVSLADNYAVTEVVPIDFAAVKAGAFIGTAAMPQADGSLVALEVLVFPEAARGSGEGHYPWDLQPQSTMTNATIAAAVDSAKGRELTLNYKGGSNKVMVPQGVPVVTFEPGDRAIVKSGANVMFTATIAADGAMSAARVLVGRGSLVPPM
ncbi:MAG: hypothetical protein HY246_16440 [Proteobacteria bacterium]|nr:hypothetical protein [Pseudomonadota bacterium]